MEYAEVPNLDGYVDPNEISALIETFQLPHWAHEYAHNKRLAMERRLFGDIRWALKYEARCDRIYDQHLRHRVDW